MKLEISSHKLQSIKCVTEGVAILEVEGVAIFEIRARVVQGRASLRGRGSILTGTTWEVVAAELGTQFPIRTAKAVENHYDRRIDELAKHLPRPEFDALAKKYLSEAQKQINNKEPFYIALEKAMHNFLKAKLSIETSDMSKDKISEILLSKSANQETISDFIALTENFELARYAPSTSVTIQQDYDKAVEIISNLEKQLV